MVEKMQEGRRTGGAPALRPPQPGDGNGGQSSRLRMARGRLDAGGPRLGQAAGDARAVAGGKEVGDGAVSSSGVSWRRAE